MCDNPLKVLRQEVSNLQAERMCLKRENVPLFKLLFKAII